MEQTSGEHIYISRFVEMLSQEENACCIFLIVGIIIAIGRA